MDALHTDRVLDACPTGEGICPTDLKTKEATSANGKARLGAVARATMNLGRRNTMQGYCVKCRTSREMRNPQAVTTKNGKPATKGTCPVCNVNMFRIGKAGP